jgi:hypothetical protein
MFFTKFVVETCQIKISNFVLSYLMARVKLPMYDNASLSIMYMCIYNFEYYITE